MEGLASAGKVQGKVLNNTGTIAKYGAMWSVSSNATALVRPK